MKVRISTSLAAFLLLAACARGEDARPLENAAIADSLAAAEDAAQEVFIKAYQSLDKFGGASSFSTWLYRIASNHCLDILRRRSREKEESLEALLEKEGGNVNIQRLLPSTADASLSVENADLVERALAPIGLGMTFATGLSLARGTEHEPLSYAITALSTLAFAFTSIHPLLLLAIGASALLVAGA